MYDQDGISNDRERGQGTPGDAFADSLNALYRQYYQRDATAEEIAAHRGNPGGLAAVEAALKGSQATPAAPGATAPGAAPSGGGAPSTDIYTSPLTRPFDQPFNAPSPVNLGGPSGIPYVPQTPSFTPPGFTPPKFTAPSAEEALNSPGYQFRLGQGRDSLQHWAAARGTLNDSGTAKALVDYGQNAASQEYGNVWNRAYGQYQADLGSAQAGYNANYQGWRDATLAPGILGYQTQAAAGEHATDRDYLNSWNKYLSDQNYFSNWQDRTFNKQFQVATA